MPSSRAASMGHGFSMMAESGPPSMTNPSRRTVRTLPPRRGSLSISSQSSEPPARRAFSSTRAAPRPAMPPPTTATRGAARTPPAASLTASPLVAAGLRRRAASLAAAVVVRPAGPVQLVLHRPPRQVVDDHVGERLDEERRVVGRPAAQVLHAGRLDLAAQHDVEVVERLQVVGSRNRPAPRAPCASPRRPANAARRRPPAPATGRRRGPCSGSPGASRRAGWPVRAGRSSAGAAPRRDRPRGWSRAGTLWAVNRTAQSAASAPSSACATRSLMARTKPRLRVPALEHAARASPPAASRALR